MTSLLGHVDHSLQPIVPIMLVGPGGNTSEYAAMLDTGFDGWLTLPSATIEKLELPWQAKARALVADGRTETFDIFAGQLVWFGRSLRIEIEAVESLPLIGTALLRNCKLEIEMVADGRVAITPME
ncbi:MAG TPA: hypothetical protein VHZ24_07580 [Pirellulales bacterium]|jgi:clan AA aspartic protease|nr:hypothetical protein [Pirellulales bacterium]